MEPLARIKDILRDILHVAEIPDTATQQDFPEWDSMAYLAITLAIESEFEVELTRENIDRFGSVQGILEEVARARNAS